MASKSLTNDYLMTLLKMKIKWTILELALKYIEFEIAKKSVLYLKQLF